MILGDYLIGHDLLEKHLLRLIGVDKEHKKILLQCVKISTGVEIVENGEIREFDIDVLNELPLACPRDLRDFGIEVTVQ